MARIRMVCTHCGSEDVRLDAWAEWDFDNQQWTLGETYDHAHCHKCEGETSIDEIDADAEEAAECQP